MNRQAHPEERSWLANLLTKAFFGLERLPRWLVPAALGAGLMFIITLLRGFLMLALSGDRPGQLTKLLLALVVAPAAGAVAGLAYVPLRRPLRLLGALGDVVTGVYLAWMYLLALLLPAKYLFGDDMLASREDWMGMAVTGAVFGVIGAISYRYHLHRS